MEIISLSDARSSGKDKYFTGKKCKRGHISQRTVKNGMCIECAAYHRNTTAGKERQKLYRSKYYINNKDHVNNKSRLRRRVIQKDRPYVLLIQGAKKRAVANGIDFNLDVIWGEKTWTGICALSGIPFTEYSESGNKELSPSIDRIVPSKGYTKENCRFILNCLNRFKGVMSDAEMLRISCNLINNNQSLAVGIPAL